MISIENLEGGGGRRGLAQINLPFEAVSEFMQKSPPSIRSNPENSSK